MQLAKLTSRHDREETATDDYLCSATAESIGVGKWALRS